MALTQQSLPYSTSGWLDTFRSGQNVKFEPCLVNGLLFYSGKMYLKRRD